MPEPKEPEYEPTGDTYVPMVKRTAPKTGFSVHVTYDVMGVETREEARERIMDNLPEVEGIKIVQVHVSKYTTSSLADGLEDLL